MCSEIGVPRVLPSYTPLRIRTVSDSLRCVTMWLWPGARRSSSGCMSASERLRRGGHPSTTAPIAAPCDSPQVVTRKRWPKVLASGSLPDQPRRPPLLVDPHGCAGPDQLVATQGHAADFLAADHRRIGCAVDPVHDTIVRRRERVQVGGVAAAPCAPPGALCELERHPPVAPVLQPTGDPAV